MNTIIKVIKANKKNIVKGDILVAKSSDEFQSGDIVIFNDFSLGTFFEKFENFELVGIYDIKEERCNLARENGVKVYDSFEAVLEDEGVLGI